MKSEITGSALANMELDVGDKAYLDIFIWPDVVSMREFTQQSGKCMACYNAGEIHLVEGEFGAGIFAHELQHFIQDWISKNDLDPMNGSWEEIAYLAGDMTTDFWNWFYDNFELEQ